MKSLRFAALAIATLATLQISAEPTRVWHLDEISQLSDGTEFEYVGFATAYLRTSNQITLDDHTAFNTYDVVGECPGLNSYNMVTDFTGKVISQADNKILIDLSPAWVNDMFNDPTHPVVSGKNDGFENFPNRWTIFDNVTITTDDNNPEFYKATASNGSTALISIAATPDLKEGNNISFQCVPYVDAETGLVTLHEVNICEPTMILKSLREMNELPYGVSYRFEGDFTVYYIFDGLVIDDGDFFTTVGIDYLPETDWPKPGEGIKEFSGRSANKEEGGLITSGHDGHYHIMINGNSIVKSDDIRELTPHEANENEGFYDYYARLATFKNVTLRQERVNGLSEMETVYIATLPNGKEGMIFTKSIIDDEFPELTTYETMTCVSVYAGGYPTPNLRQVSFGAKAEVEAIECDGDAVVRYIDIYGRSYDSKPAASGVFVEVYNSGKTRKVVL